MKRLICILFTASTLFSCKKQLDQQPISDISSEQFWQTAEHARLGVAGVYDGVQKTLSGNYTDWGDARSDNFTYGGTGENQINITFNGLSATTPAANWNNLYMTIGRANAAIKYLPSIKELSVLLRNNYLAQAHAVRAFMYWYAVRVWGAVPVRLVPYEDPQEDPNVRRSSADSVINNVILPDLEKALTLVDRTATANTWEINNGTILSMLAEVHLWRKDYAKVITISDQLLALNRYLLVPSTSYKDVFVVGTTRENIWSVNWNYLVDGGNGIARIGSASGSSQYYIDSVVLLKWEGNKVDIRRALNYDTLRANGLLVIEQNWKFYPQIDPLRPPVIPAAPQNEAKLVLYRWADILLMRAEALNWGNNDKAGAIGLVNQVRARARVTNLNVASLVTQLDVEKAILDERQLELFAEGKRWFDLLRTGRAMQVMDPVIRNRQRKLGIGESGFTDPRTLLWPIHREALSRNPLLIQNPPYSD